MIRAVLERLRRRSGSGTRAPDRWYLETTADCNAYLVTRGAWLAEHTRCQRILAVGRQPPPAGHPVMGGLRRAGLEVQWRAIAEVAEGARITGIPAAVVCLDLDSTGAMAAARACLAHPQLKTVPFEYATSSEVDYATLLRHDDPHYSKTHFRSPLLIDPAMPLRIYEESLQRFERKCDIRDFMDLYQAVHNIVDQDIAGDIAEFGSFKGHSGYLISQSLLALGSNRHVYLFDTFESFPSEAAGLDAFWSNTHEVSFDEVKAAFSEVQNVSLVKGEFESTMPAARQRTCALVHIDCDSYRAVKYVAENMLPALSVGGLMVFEDYGHPALLGARLAVEEFAGSHPECFRFFSQFSGIYVLQKTRG